MLVEKVRLVSKDEVSLTESRPRLRGRCPERAEGAQKAGKKIYIKTPIGPDGPLPPVRWKQCLRSCVVAVSAACHQRGKVIVN